MKTYYVQQNVGKARYLVSFHDGVKTHKDGSPFFDGRILRNKKELKCLLARLEKEGFSDR